jgi:hypothetical protein
MAPSNVTPFPRKLESSRLAWTFPVFAGFGEFQLCNGFVGEAVMRGADTEVEVCAIQRVTCVSLVG